MLGKPSPQRPTPACHGRLSVPVVFSAPGKVILFGEHSVVYGKRSIAFSLGLRTALTITPIADEVQLHLPEIHIEKCWSVSSLSLLFESIKNSRIKLQSKERLQMSEDEERILRSFLGITKKELGKADLGLLAFLHLYTSILSEPHPFSIRVRSEMPVGAGLGSSAAYAVCLAGSLMWISGQLKIPNHDVPDQTHLPKSYLNIISDWAFSCEKILHGTPSGIDNSICTYGGGVSLKAGKIEHILCPPLRIMLVDTKVTRNTKTLVGKVRERYTKHGGIVNGLLETMDRIAESGLTTMNEMQANGISSQALNQKMIYLAELVAMNHCVLSALDVSHSSLEEIVRIARVHGLAAKLTGAGGGGFGFILLPPAVCQAAIDQCQTELQAKGFEAWITELGGNGITFNFLKQ